MMQKNNKFKPAHKTFSPSLVTPTLRASICAGYSEGHQKAALYPALRHCGMMTNAARGFTLIELLVVVLIIGILAAVALPQYQKAVEKSRAAQALTLLKSIGQAARAYHTATGEYPSSFDALDIQVPWTASTAWHEGNEATDTRSNNDWSLQLYNNGNEHEIYIGRLNGPYQGAGFILPLSTITNQWQEDKIYCAERKQKGIVFQKTPGDYCQKIFGGTVVYPAGYVTIYSLD